MAQTVKNLLAVWENQVQFWDQDDPLGKEMAAYSSILAWRIPWRKEPNGPQSIGSCRVGHDRACTHTVTLEMHTVDSPILCL